MTSTPASLSRHLLACLVFAGSAAPAPAAEPPPTTSPQTPDAGLARTLGDVRQDALRHPPDAAGATAVSSLFARSFRQLGLFPAAVSAGEVVSQSDFEHLEAVAARSVATRREVLHALDDWLLFLEQSGSWDKRVHPTLTLLRGSAVRLEADEPRGLPLCHVRSAVAARDAETLLALFEGEKARRRSATTCFVTYPADSSPRPTPCCRSPTTRPGRACLSSSPASDRRTRR